MQIVAVAGVIVAVGGLVVAWTFLGQLERSVDRSLTIGEEAADALEQTIDVADDVITSVDEGLVAIGDTLETIRGTIDDTAGVAASVAGFADGLPASVDDIDGALSTVESLSATVDDALRALSAVPFGPDYDPDVPLPEAVGDLRASLGPITDDLERVASELSSFAAGSGELRARADALRADVESTRQALQQSDALLETYRRTTQAAGDLAVTSREDLTTSMRWTRATVVALAAELAAAMFVPWWLGGVLRRSGDGRGPERTGDPPVPRIAS